MKFPLRSWGGSAYLGEKVVNEKEYLSAITSFEPEIRSGITPKKKRCGWESSRFADRRKVEGLSCSSRGLLKFKLQAAPAASRGSRLTAEAEISKD
jgi:hypothetical protein